MPTFSDGLARSVQTIERKMTLVHQKVALSAFREVVLMSPVDTGRFRGNWQVDISESQPHVDVQFAGWNSEAGVLAEIASIVSQIKNGDAVWLMNGLPYAIPLEYGWSDQAPGGMVRLTVQRWDPIVEQAVKELQNL